MSEAGSSRDHRLTRSDRGHPAGSVDQTEAILAAQTRVLELMATGCPFDTVLEGLVDAVEAQCAGAIGSVLLLDDDGEHLRHGSAPRLPDSYNRAIDGVRIGPSVGSCGTAAYLGEPVVVEDIETDPLWEEYRDLARKHGLRACWSQPIFSSTRKVLGTFAVYYREPRSRTVAEERYIAAIAYLAGIAAERDRTERAQRVAERRLLKQKTVLVELARSAPLVQNDFKAFTRLTVERAAETLGVERVSVWRFNEERTVMCCEDLYEVTLDRHSSGLELESSRYPRYFAALERGRGVVAHDVHQDPDTSEFSESYLKPLGISSMLDAPIRRTGQLSGVVCHEHIGPARVWAVDEQEFAASIGDFLSLVLEASERRHAQQAFRSAQEALLRQDYQARHQIELELDRIKDELVRQTRLATIGQVAASLAHELRNPLGAIRNATFYLRNHVPAGDQKWTDHLAIIDQEVGRSDVTINDLLEMSQAKQPIKQTVDLRKLVQESFDLVRSSEDLTLELVVEKPFFVDADPGQLRQVMANLMGNAAEAIGRSGRIRVEARRGERFAEISVRDDGPGIPADLRQRVFEPLITTKAKGTGLGLSICRQIVERHGGTIELVDSEGRGAEFCIRLPRADVE
jgi:signal transduction histidine kinase